MTMMVWFNIIILLWSLGGALVCSSAEPQPPLTDASTVCRSGGFSDTCDEEADLRTALLGDIKSSLAPNNHDTTVNGDPKETTFCVPKNNANLELAIRDFSPETGAVAWKFLRGIANSPTFVEEYWQRRPVLIRSGDTGGWVAGSFTLEEDLRLVDNTYMTGFKTAEILRNGTKTDTWALSPLKADPAKKTSWQEVKKALEGGTIYFNTAGSLWPNLGGLCRLTSYAFGLPPNVNVYVTPPGLKLSVPPHTDRQDVFVFQTQGSKRWRVFAPPPRSNGADPLDRGKGGNILSFEEMGSPLIDTVLRPGDVLYVPTGFPHTTDTSTLVDGADEAAFDETSVHLTMGLDTHVWFLSMAHMRWTLLQRCGKEWRLDIKDDQAYWDAMGTFPFGFLGGDAWKRTIQNLERGSGVDKGFKQKVAEEMKKILIQLEPNRWTFDGSANKDGEALPSDSQIDEVTDYMVQSHWRDLMDTQEDLFKDIDPSKEEIVVKAFHGIQKQNLIMEKFGEFSKNEAFANSYRQRRLSAEQKTQGFQG